MNAEIAKILGENLDSNGTMVLFNDIDMTIPSGSVVTQYDLAVYDTIEEASDAYYNLESYLNEKAKSHTIITRPRVISEDFDSTFIIPILYAVNGAFKSEVFYYTNTFISVNASISAGLNIDETAYAVRIVIKLEIIS